jgi:hypothetical protein
MGSGAMVSGEIWCLEVVVVGRRKEELWCLELWCLEVVVRRFALLHRGVFLFHTLICTGRILFCPR